MSFTSMHNDHLDPDRAGLNDENWGLDFEEVRKILDSWSSHRWPWAKITYCLTGEDADLESHGQQGVELVSVDEDGVDFIVHGGKTFAGHDVCLNIPDDTGMNDDAEWQRCLDLFLDQMYEFICGSGYPGEWSGDDWFMSFDEAASVPWSYKDDGVTPDYEATCNAIVAKLDEVIKPWEDEMVSLDHWGDVLAGWRNEAGERIKAGDPTPEAAWGSGSEE